MASSTASLTKFSEAISSSGLLLASDLRSDRAIDLRIDGSQGCFARVHGGRAGLGVMEEPSLPCLLRGALDFSPRFTGRATGGFARAALDDVEERLLQLARHRAHGARADRDPVHLRDGCDLGRRPREEELVEM